MSRAWAGGSTRRWRATRRAVLDDNRAQRAGRCQLARPGVCTGYASVVHHVHGKAAGDDPAGLLATCAACNLAVGDPTRAADPTPTPRTRW